jgi:hypothetical protein
MMHESTTFFQLPQKCPAKAALSCPESLNGSGAEVLLNGTPVKLVEKVVQIVNTSALHLKKKKSKAPMVASEVRRSDRLKAITQWLQRQSL